MKFLMITLLLLTNAYSTEFISTNELQKILSNYISLGENIGKINNEECEVNYQFTNSYLRITVIDPSAEDDYGVSIYIKSNPKIEVLKGRNSIEIIDYDYDGDEVNGSYEITHTVKLTKENNKIHVQATYFNDVLSEDVEIGNCILK